VIVESVWTADEAYRPKMVFLPGDEIRYIGDIFNSSSRVETAELTWDVDGPCGPADDYTGWQAVDPGRMPWYLPSALPPDACGGTYTYRMSVTFNGHTTTQTTTFTVISPITPTPTATETAPPARTATHTPTRTATVTAKAAHTPTPTVTGTPPAKESREIYLPLLIKLDENPY
jgi:hypothetical protein